MKSLALLISVVLFCAGCATVGTATQNAKHEKPRVIVTSDGEIDDQCSLIRFLLYANEWDVEGIITSSSQYHWQGHKWAGDDWIEPDLDAYAKIHPNLLKHDKNYPTPEYLRARTFLGNVKAEGEMEEVTAGSEHIVKVLLDDSDDRPIWLQAWGGTNTIARALKTIEEKYPERKAEVAKKIRFFFIWEQDSTYRDYIKRSWRHYQIPTIISDQFEAIAYRWKQTQPKDLHKYFEAPWMKENILENHGPLCAIYAAHKEGDEAKTPGDKPFKEGDFRSEGDSPAFLHTIPTGLRSMESPGWGGWGGRYVRVNESIWLDPVPVADYAHPRGRWYGSTGWGRNSLREGSTTTVEQRREYFKPMWRWTEAMQNDFAARADWSVKPYEEANHPPVVKLDHSVDLKAKPGETIRLSAKGSSDPDDDELTFKWWQYQEADTYAGSIKINGVNKNRASFKVPTDVGHGQTIHIVVEVTDTGTPALTRYQRVVVTVVNLPKPSASASPLGGAIDMPPMTAFFPFDEGEGKVVSDVVGGAKGALVNLDPAVAWVSGLGGSALRLDGKNDHIVVPNNPAFDFGDGSFTVAFQMRWPKNVKPLHHHFIIKGDYESDVQGETGKRWELTMINKRGIAFIVDDDVNRSSMLVSPDAFVTGEWINVALVRDTKAKRLNIYIDGVLQESARPNDPMYDGVDRVANISNPQDLFIGDSSRIDNPLQADLDNFRVYHHALTQTQIAQLKNLNSLAIGPASYFPLDEGKGIVVTDEVTGAVGLLEESAPEATWVTGKVGGAVRLDGKKGRVVVPNNLAFDFADEDFSLSFLMRWPKGLVPHHERVFTKGDFEAHVPGETGKRWEMFMPPEGLCWLVDDDIVKSQVRVPFDAITTGEWVHIVAVRDTKNNQLRVYADGVLQQSNDPNNPEFDGVDRSGSISNPRALFIGDSSRRDTTFEGELDEVKIYGYVLTEDQIKAMSNSR